MHFVHKQCQKNHRCRVLRQKNYCCPICWPKCHVWDVVWTSQFNEQLCLMQRQFEPREKGGTRTTERRLTEFGLVNVSTNRASLVRKRAWEETSAENNTFLSMHCRPIAWMRQNVKRHLCPTFVVCLAFVWPFSPQFKYALVLKMMKKFFQQKIKEIIYPRL